jgi:hypothetical protein
MEPAVIDPEIVRVRASGRRALKQGLALAVAGLVFAVVVGVGLGWRLSWKSERAATRQVQAYYDRTSPEVVRVSNCSRGTDVERSIALQVCRISSSARAVFSVRPAAVIRGGSAALCFMVSDELVRFFGVEQDRSSQLCIEAEGTGGPFYRE